MSGGNRSSTPGNTVENRAMFPSMLRQDLNTASHPVGSTPQYPSTSSPGPGLLGQGASLMALGHNVMFPGGKLMPSSAHETHRYMAEAYRLAAGESESHRLPYPIAGVSTQSHTASETHRSTVDIRSPPVISERPLSGSTHESQTEEAHYSSVAVPTHVNLDSPRLESHPSRLHTGLERLPQNGNRSSSTTKADSEHVHYSKPTYSSSVSDVSQHSSSPTKNKSVPGPLTAANVFPMSFPPTYQQYSEENNVNFKRHYFDEASSAPRREALSTPVGSGGDLSQINKVRHESGNIAGSSDISHYDNDCASQDMYGHDDSSKNENRPESLNSDLGLLPQATTPTNADIIMHAKMPRARTTKLYKCQICDQEFKNGTQLKNHTWRHTGEKPFSCAICQATFTQQSNLKTHMRIHTGERPYTCDDCHASFTQISNLRTHQKTHTGEKPYECDICCTRFSQQSNLKSHKLIHTGERPFKCEECGATFVQSTHLRNHRRIHTDERPYACDQCGSRFRQLSNLKTHEKIHTGERPYICEECGSAFAQKSNLKSHSIKLHSNDGIPSRRGRKKKLEAIRPYICEECGAKFTILSNLKIHNRLHTGEKPHQCSMCGASFAQRSNLKAHEQTHTDERPYKCSECHAAFRQKTNLKTHKMKKHPVKSLKIKILQDSQYIMHDHPNSLDDVGEGPSNHIEEPIVQIKEGKCDQLHVLAESAMEEVERNIKLENEVYGTRDGTVAWKNAGIMSSEPSSHETNPYDSHNF